MMAKVRFTSESMPQSGENLKQALRQALEQTTPLDDFVQVIRDLTQYEIRHGMNSSSFFARFEAGELGDDIDLIRWANKYEIYRETKAELDQMVDLIYDNVPHHPEIKTHPHHKHIRDSVVATQPPDLGEVLREIDAVLYKT